MDGNLETTDRYQSWVSEVQDTMGQLEHPPIFPLLSLFIFSFFSDLVSSLLTPSTFILLSLYFLTYSLYIHSPFFILPHYPLFSSFFSVLIFDSRIVSYLVSSLPLTSSFPSFIIFPSPFQFLVYITPSFYNIFSDHVLLHFPIFNPLLYSQPFY